MTEFLGVSPRLPVINLARQLAFYRDVLGFESGEPWPREAPTFCLAWKGAAVLQFDLAEENTAARDVTVCLNVADARAVYEAVKGRVTIEWGPEVYWYGRREFSFRDPEGYGVIISEVTSDPPDCTDGSGT